ncbi:MAG: hypothetical protein LAN64_19785 [Acidobacteriia bacterium]|nr:hypothetical protein [Terriglobia bacterium]
MAFAQGAKISAENSAESERDRPQERARWFLRGRMVNGKPGAEQLHRAYNQKLNNRRLQGLARDRSTQSATASSTGAGTASPRPLFVTAPSGSAPWNFLGPSPTATGAFNSAQQDYGPAVGRVTSVVVDQSDTTGNTVYIGGASGGLWKTTNAVSATRSCNSNGVCTAPVTWTPLTDGQATLTVGAIALQPGNSSLILVGTGEANNSADSYYGLGILRSTDRGANWTLISSATCPTSNPACPSSGTVSFHGLGFTHIAFSTDDNKIAVATAAAASGGITVGAESGGSNARGIYYSTDAGATWNRANVSDGATSPDAGSANSVIYNPTQKKFYANLRYHGFYSSTDGANWTHLANQPSAPGVDLSLTTCPSSPFSSACPLYRAEMAVLPAVLDSNGNRRDEMYVWIYDSQDSDIGIWQTKNGGQTWTQISTTGIDNCGDSLGCGTPSTGQGTYNISLAAVPNGGATDLYAGGVNQYKCTINPVTNPTCTTSPFMNLTHVYGCSPSANIAHVHPDEHGIDFLGNDVTGAYVAAHPGFDPPIFFGNDGGIYRVAKGSLLTSGTCPPGTPPSQFDNLSTSIGFSMIQFVGFSHHATDPTTLVGGTQDNGSPAVSSASPSSGNWLSVNNGDGGFNAINPLSGSGNEWFTSNPAPLKANGGIQRCTTGISCTNQTFTAVVTQDKIGGDYSSFYTFFMLDLQASTRMLVGSCRVWRGNSDGLGSDWSVGGSGGNPLTLNLDTGVNASCGDPTVNPTTFMVNTIAAGGPCKGPCDPGITPTSGTGGGSQVIWAGMEGIADSTNAAAQCIGAKPCGGQVWRTLAADSGASSWSEVSGINNGVTTACTAAPSACNINPSHYPISGIALDPNDSSGNTAYVTVMGFGVGHIFKTSDAGATWAKLDGDPSTTGLPDAPADAVTIPPASAVTTYPSLANVIYVGTDVGVFQSVGDGVWTEVGPSSGAGSLPNVAITQLKIYNNPSDPAGVPLRLRASTYGRGIWEVSIAPVPGFQVAVTPPTATAVVGQTASYNGTITLFNGYNSSISLSCQPVSGALPSICTINPPTLAAGATSFTVTAGDPAANAFNFKIVAVGGDPKAVTQQFLLTLNSVTPFSIGTASNASTPAGAPATTSFTVTASTTVSGSLTFSFACSGLPAGAGPCSFSPAAPTLAAGVTASINVTIPTATSTPVATSTITITATASNFSLPTTFTLNVLTAPDFTMGVLSPATLNLSPTDTGDSTFTLNPNTTFSGAVTLACTGVPTGAGPCSFTPASPSLTAGQSAPTTVGLSIPLTNIVPGTYTVAVNASASIPGGAVQHSQSLSLNVTTNSWGISAGALSPTPARPGQPLAATVTISPAAYSGTVSLSCALADTVGHPVPSTTCAMTVPSMIFTANSAPQTSIANVTTTLATPATNQVLTVTAQDTITTRIRTFNYVIVDYTLTAGTAAPVLANGSTTSFPLTLGGLNGFTGIVQAQCSVPSPLTCTLTPPSPYSLSATTTVSATATVTAPTNSGGSYSANLTTNDATFPGLTHNQSVSVSVQDFRPPAVCSSTSVPPACDTTATVKAGSSATFNIAVAALGGFTGAVSFDPAVGGGCTGLPALTTCTFSPVSVAVGGTSTLTIQTTAPSVSQLRPPAARHTAPFYALWLTMPGMAFGLIGVLSVPKSKRGKPGWASCIGLTLSIGLLLLISACGGGGGGSTTPPPIPKPGTPAGNYTITVTGVSGSGATALTHFTQITLQVQ